MIRRQRLYNIAISIDLMGEVNKHFYAAYTIQFQRGVTYGTVYDKVRHVIDAIQRKVFTS